jgi:NAD(P)-dependent dehydrogenase (short-subunit alcohol dehydrogenase family)
VTDHGLQGKTALVTGAARGMGRASALAFAAAGANVAVADVDEEGGRETAELIHDRGGVAQSLHCDVSDGKAVEALVRDVVERFGALDCACNNAGIELEDGLLADVEDHVFDSVIAVNLRGVFLCMKHEIRQMQKQGGGTIVNVGSVNSLRPQPTGAVYTSTKHGVAGLTRAAASSYAAEGIRVNAVLPGAIDTEMLRGKMAAVGLTADDVVPELSLNGRFGRPEEVAEAVLWLSSDRSSYTFGHLLAVDGGYLAR